MGEKRNGERIKRTGARMYSNNHPSRKLRPTPNFKEYEVDADFAHRVVGKLVATREYCSQEQ